MTAPPPANPPSPTPGEPEGFEDRLLDYIEGDLSPQAERELEAELQRDPAAWDLARKVRADRQSLRAARPEDAPAGLIDEALARLERDALLGEPLGAESIPATARHAGDTARPTRAVLARIGFLTAAAAGLAIGATALLSNLSDSPLEDFASNVERATPEPEPQDPGQPADSLSDGSRLSGRETRLDFDDSSGRAPGSAADVRDRVTAGAALRRSIPTPDTEAARPDTLGAAPTAAGAADEAGRHFGLDRLGERRHARAVAIERLFETAPGAARSTTAAAGPRLDLGATPTVTRVAGEGGADPAGLGLRVNVITHDARATAASLERFGADRNLVLASFTPPPAHRFRHDTHAAVAAVSDGFALEGAESPAPAEPQSADPRVIADNATNPPNPDSDGSRRFNFLASVGADGGTNPDPADPLNAPGDRNETRFDTAPPLRRSRHSERSASAAPALDPNLELSQAAPSAALGETKTRLNRFEEAAPAATPSGPASAPAPPRVYYVQLAPQDVPELVSYLNRDLPVTQRAALAEEPQPQAVPQARAESFFAQPSAARRNADALALRYAEPRRHAGDAWNRDDLRHQRWQRGGQASGAPPVLTPPHPTTAFAQADPLWAASGLPVRIELVAASEPSPEATPPTAAAASRPARASAPSRPAPPATAPSP